MIANCNLHVHIHTLNHIGRYVTETEQTLSAPICRRRQAKEHTDQISLVLMAFLKHKSIFKVIPKRANKSTTKILTHLKRAKTFECTTNNLTHSICYTRWMKIANEKFQPLAGRLSRRVDSGQAKTKTKKNRQTRR